MGFSAQTVTSIAQGENPYTAYARPLLIIVVSLLIAMVVQLVPQRWFVYLAPVMFVGALGFQTLVLSPLGRSEGGNANWVKIGSDHGPAVGVPEARAHRFLGADGLEVGVEALGFARDGV